MQKYPHGILAGTALTDALHPSNDAVRVGVCVVTRVTEVNVAVQVDGQPGGCVQHRVCAVASTRAEAASTVTSDKRQVPCRIRYFLDDE